MAKKLLFLGSVFAGLAVILGAFGAHLLKKMLAPEALAIWATAVQYQFWHALALFALGVLVEKRDEKKDEEKVLGWVGNFWTAGIVCFSGSLYGLAFNGILDEKLAFLGPITPIGGFFFIAGWAVAAVHFWKSPKSEIANSKKKKPRLRANSKPGKNQTYYEKLS